MEGADGGRLDRLQPLGARFDHPDGCQLARPDADFRLSAPARCVALERSEHQLGAKPVTLSDSSGFIFDPGDIDRDKLEWVKDLKERRRGRISEYTKEFGVEYHEGKRPWQVPCQLAFPCATQNELNRDEAEALLKSGCMGVSEGANMRSEQAAIDAFQDAKILFVPSKAANAVAWRCRGWR